MSFSDSVGGLTSFALIDAEMKNKIHLKPAKHGVNLHYLNVPLCLLLEGEIVCVYIRIFRFSYFRPVKLISTESHISIML